ncbi:MAG: hypothetical protein HXY40_02735 [Chloroflexi bacterium]|nr:hypothetical protein [Chloroflexota bacterium]
MCITNPTADSPLIVEAHSQEAAQRLFDADLWATHSILSAGTVKPWLIFLDTQRRGL